VLLCVLLLVVAVLYLYRNLPKIRAEDPRFKMVYGFLFNGYHKDRWYWEFIVLTRKIVLVAISVYLTENLQVQALCSILLCCVALALQLYFQPFEAWEMNLVEAASLISSFITFYCSAFLFVDAVAESQQVAASLTVVAVNMLYDCCCIPLVILLVHSASVC
jgi:hypothetical protein